MRVNLSLDFLRRHAAAHQNRSLYRAYFSSCQLTTWTVFPNPRLRSATEDNEPVTDSLQRTLTSSPQILPFSMNQPSVATEKQTREQIITNQRSAPSESMWTSQACLASSDFCLLLIWVWAKLFMFNLVLFPVIPAFLLLLLVSLAAEHARTPASLCAKEQSRALNWVCWPWFRFQDVFNTSDWQCR